MNDREAIEFKRRLPSLTDAELTDLQHELCDDLDASTLELGVRLGLIHRERCRRIDERARAPLPF